MKRIRIIIFCFSIICCQNSPYFNGDKAYNHLLKQCEFGARYPGSEAHENFKDYLINFLENKADSLLIDIHSIKHPYNQDSLYLYNIFARYNLFAENRIMLMAHWDTREMADKDPNPKNINKPIIGANDGASGVSILMELAEILSNSTIENIGVDLLFVDGEDMGRSGDIDNFSIGTKLFSKSMKNNLPQLAICLDMVGEINAEFKMEYFSFIQAGNDLKEIWDLANQLGYSEFKFDFGQRIYDDHRALFIETGIPSIDIIDFDYPYWHTLEDTPDKCSPITLQKVGQLMIEYLYRKDKENE